MAGDKTTSIGLRHVRVARRDDDGTIMILGSPAAGTAYAGLRAERARALTITPAEPQRVYAEGDDIVFHGFMEAPSEMPSGELRVQQTDVTLLALITSTRDFGSENAHQVVINSDKLGTEDPMIIWGSNKAITSAIGSAATRQWDTYILLNAQLYARPPAKELRTVGEFIYNVMCNMSSTDQFGRTMTEAIHGCTEAAYVIVQTRYQFWMDAFEGDGSETEFTLTKGAYTIYNTATSPVWCFVDGVQTACSVSSLGVVTIAPAPADGAKIVIQYEYDS